MPGRAEQHPQRSQDLPFRTGDQATTIELVGELGERRERGFAQRVAQIVGSVGLEVASGQHPQGEGT